MRLVLWAICSCLFGAEDWHPLKVIATAYCPCSLCCGVRAVGITADGTDVSEVSYGVAVDPRQIPYGTSLHIPTGEGYLDNQRPDDRIFPADDTGGIIRRRTRSTGVIHIDLRFRRHSSAVKFGIKPMTIWIWK